VQGVQGECREEINGSLGSSEQLKYSLRCHSAFLGDKMSRGQTARTVASNGYFHWVLLQWLLDVVGGERVRPMR
jgi:hypothetical protein